MKTAPTSTQSSPAVAVAGNVVEVPEEGISYSEQASVMVALHAPVKAVKPEPGAIPSPP